MVGRDFRGLNISGGTTRELVDRVVGSLVRCLALHLSYFAY